VGCGSEKTFSTSRSSSERRFPLLLVASDLS
jgi:hypothetical protein